MKTLLEVASPVALIGKKLNPFKLVYDVVQRNEIRCFNCLENILNFASNFVLLDRTSGGKTHFKGLIFYRCW